MTMIGKYRRRALVVLAVLGLGAAHLVTTSLPAQASAVWIPPNQNLNGVTPDPGQIDVTPPGDPVRDGIPYRAFAFAERNRCLDADSDTIRQNGGKAQIFGCNGTVFQGWFFDHTGVEGLYRIRTMFRPDGCLDADNSVPSHNRLQIWHCIGTSQHNQLWWLTTTGHARTQIKSDFNGKCIQIEDNNFGTGSPLFLADCNAGSDQQQWWPHDPTPDPPPETLPPCPPICNQ
jgi:hypothetical protein